MVDLSRLEGGHHDPDMTPHGTTPVDRIDRDIDLERGEAPSERITSRDLNPTTRSSIEAIRTRRATEPSRISKNHTKMSPDLAYQNHNLASSSRTSRISMAATSNSLWGTHQGAPQGQPAPAEEMNFSAMQTRLTKPVLPGNMSREHALHSRARRRPSAGQIPRSNKVDSQVPPEPSTKGYQSYIPTDKRSSDIQVLHLEIIQQDTKFATSEAPNIEQQNFKPNTRLVDWITPNLNHGEEACYLKFDHVNKDLYGTHTSKSPPSAGSIEECGNTVSTGAMDVHTSDAHRAHTGHTVDCDSFASSTKTSCEETSMPSLSSPELAPQIPRTDHGSSASGFTRRFMESMSGIYTGDDEQHEAHSTIAMSPRELPDEK